MKEKRQVTYEITPFVIIFDFSTETIKAKSVWTDVVDTPSEHRC